MGRILRYWRWILSPILLLTAILLWNRPIAFRREWDPVALWPGFAAVSLTGAAIGLPMRAGIIGAIAAPITLIAALLVVGCIALLIGEPSDPYVTTVHSGATEVPVAVQMEKLYPDCDHFITHFGQSFAGPQMWNSEVFFAGRYVLTMQVKVAVDYDNHRVEQVGQPHFRLIEIESVTRLADGVYETSIGRNLDFDIAEWKQLVESHGDLWPLGYSILGDEIPLFWDYVAAVRRDRVRISLVSTDGGM